MVCAPGAGPGRRLTIRHLCRPPRPAVKRKTRKALGRILLKGDTITLMQAAK